LVGTGISALAMKDVRGDPNRLCQRTRPRWRWTRAQPGPTWDKHDSLSDLSPELDAKRVEILKEALPRVRLAKGVSGLVTANPSLCTVVETATSAQLRRLRWPGRLPG